MRFRAFWVDWDTLFFFENFREREAQNAREQSERVGLIECFIKKSFSSLEIVYAVKDCDSCGRAILYYFDLVSHK